jgi:DNA-binding XRE family transcriptional regulator
MTQKARIYIASANASDEAIAVQACEEYVRARGWAGYFTEGMARTGIKSETFIRVPTPGDAIGEVLSALSGGDALVTPSISHLGTKPSEVQLVLSKIIAKGVQLHTLDLNGRAEGHLLGIFAGLATAQALEAELAALEADYQAAEARMAEEMAAFQEDLTMRFLREGVTVRAQPNGNGHAAPGVELGHQDTTADMVRHARAKKNMSLQQLADTSGVSKSQLHRIEKGEPVSEEDMAAVLTALGVGVPQGAVPLDTGQGKSNAYTLNSAEPA